MIIKPDNPLIHSWELSCLVNNSCIPFFKKGNLTKEQVGVIELKQDCAFIAVPVTEAKQLIENLNNRRLKNKKVRITAV